MENYFLPTNTKEKQTQDQVSSTGKRKKNPNQDDNLAEKKPKTATTSNSKWLSMYK